MADSQSPAGKYDARGHKMLTFHDLVPKFRDGSDTPRAFLERCAERISAIDGPIKAWAWLDWDLARKRADASTTRYKAGKPLCTQSWNATPARK